MARTVTMTIKYPNGTAWASGTVYVSLLEAFETSDTVYPAKKHTVTLDASGQATIALATPDTGTAHYVWVLPDNNNYHTYIDTGAAVDLVTLLTIAGTSVAVSDLQTLLDAAARFDVTEVTGAYVAQITDVYLRCTGSPYQVTLPPANAFPDGQPFFVKNKSTSANLTIAPNGADTVDGSAAIRTLMPTWSAAFVSDGVSDWDVLGGVA